MRITKEPQFPDPKPNVSGQNVITIFRHPDKMVFYVVNTMATVSIFHDSSDSSKDYSTQPDSGDEICPPKGGGLNPSHGKLS